MSSEGNSTRPASQQRPVSQRTEAVAFAFVGSPVPDQPSFHSAAFSRSGQMYQKELLLGLQNAGMPPSLIVSFLPTPAFPKVRRLWVPSGKADLSPGLRITLVPFLNLLLLKQIFIGVGAFVHLVRWGWRNRRAKYRVVHSYNLTIPSGLFTLLAARMIGAKAVVSLCDINIPGERVPSGWPWRLDYWLQRKLIPRFDGHTVVSDAIAREFLPGRSCLRLEGGIRKEVFGIPADPPPSTGALDPVFVISSAGSLTKTNGILILLEAFSLLRGDQYRLCIAGAGPLEPRVRDAAANDPRIAHLGMISFSEVLQLYARSDVLINMRLTKDLNTKYFFPSKMMEYLASGIPVISTCTGHVREEFGDFCYLLEEETPEALAELICAVARQSREERRKIGLKAQSYMLTHKTWQGQTERLAQYIREVVLGIKAGATAGQATLRVETAGAALSGDQSLSPRRNPDR